MEKIDTVYIDRIYNLYRCFGDHDKEHNCGVNANNREVLSLWYYCPDCGTTFMVKHRYRSMGMYIHGYGENYVICPDCKSRSVDISRRAKQIGFCINQGDFEGKVWSRDYIQEEVPVKVKLELYTTGNKVKLRATFRTIKMSLTDDKKDVITQFGNRIETFEFDVKNRKATFKVDKFSPVEIGQPKKWYGLMEESMLRHLSADVLVKSERGKYETAPRKCIESVKNLSRELWKTVQSKWLKVNKYPLKRLATKASMYEAGGLLLRQIHYLAYRLVYTDLYSAQIADNEVNTEFGSLENIINDFEATRKHKNNLSYIMECVGLPNKASIRRILSKDPLAAWELKSALEITDNFDCNMSIFDTLRTREIVHYHYSGRSDKLGEGERSRIYAWLKFVSPKYKPASLRHFVDSMQHQTYSDVSDLIRLSYSEGIDKFTAPLSKMHNILVECYNRRVRQEETKRRLLDKRRQRLCERGYSLEIPDAVKERLVMQLNNGREKFFLPETNKDLDYTSDIMHNCVRTYAKDIQLQKCNVVYMTDDNGKLVACIEVRGDAIVQAKLKYNKPVKNSAEVNANIIEWAKAVNLKIDTRDISIEENTDESDITAA